MARVQQRDHTASLPEASRFMRGLCYGPISVATISGSVKEGATDALEKFSINAWR